MPDLTQPALTSTWLAIAAIAVALIAPTLAVIIGNTMSANRTKKHNKFVEGQLDSIHTLVNSRLEEAIAKIGDLEQQLYDKRIEPEA